MQAKDQWQQSSLDTITTKVYLILWCLHLMIPFADLALLGAGSGGYDSRQLTPADYTILLPVLVTTLILLISTNSVLGAAWLAHVVDLMIRLQRLPTIWDHEIWGLLINVTFILSTLHHQQLSSSSSEAFFLQQSRLQLGILYSAATFWKLNSSFFDSKTSCGTILILEFVGTYCPVNDLPASWIDTLVIVAPYMTVVVEAVIAVGMYHLWYYNGTSVSTSLCRDATLLLACVFHLTIFMMPVNSAGGFSLECLTRLVLMFDSAELHDILIQWQTTTTSRRSLVMAILLFVPVVVLTRIRQLATGAPFDVGFGAASLLVVFYGWSVLLALSRAGQCAGGVRHPQTVSCSIEDSQQPPVSWRLTRLFVISLTIFYAFATPILGIMQMSAPTMYANLRSYRGGNHYLVPTAILGEDILYGGGLVQVLQSSSWSVNALLAPIPSELLFPPRVVQWLMPQIRADNPTLPFQVFPMLLLYPHSRELLLEEYYLSSNPTNESQLLAPMIIPISTLRQTLREAQERQEHFVVDVSVNLDPHPSSFLRIDSSSSTTGKCRQVVSDDSSTSSLEEEKEIDDCLSYPLTRKLLGPNEPSSSSSWWKPLVDKLLVPYPEIVGMKEEICMS